MPIRARNVVLGPKPSFVFQAAISLLIPLIFSRCFTLTEQKTDSVNSPRGKVSPIAIERLLLYKRHKVERLVILVRLGTGVT